MGRLTSGLQNPKQDLLLAALTRSSPQMQELSAKALLSIPIWIMCVVSVMLKQLFFSFEKCLRVMKSLIGDGSMRINSYGKCTAFLSGVNTGASGLEFM